MRYPGDVLLRGHMDRLRRSSATVIGLWAVAALLLANLVAGFMRSDSSLLPTAFAQRQPPIAGGAGVFVMPAQLSRDAWGCYLMDVDRGSLCVYQFHPGTKQLQFLAARSFINDTKLSNYNTTPSLQDVIDLVNKQNQLNRSGGATPPGGQEPPRD